VRSSCYLWLVCCMFILLLLTYVLYFRLVTFDLCTVRSSCYLWPMYCTFVLLPLTCVQEERTVHKSKITRRTYSRQVKGNKKNAQYIGQRQQEERTVHKSKVTRRTLVYCTFVLLPLTCVLCVLLVTFDLYTVRSSCYLWPMYCMFVLLPLTWTHSTQVKGNKKNVQ
jgi:SNF family Na+-dependent transporter